MYPHLPQIAGFVQSTYALICALAMFAALLPVRSEARRLGWDVEASSWLVVRSTLVGWLGAHILYAITRLDLPSAEWWRLLFSGSGSVWYGGFLLAWLFVHTYAGRRGIQPLRMYDVAAFAVLVAQAVGRLGCLAGGCCYGMRTELPWGIVITTREHLQARVHPSPLYEALWLSLVFAWLWRTRVRHARPGHSAALYLMLSAGGRFILEFLRGDQIRGFVWGWLSTSQFIALFLVGGGLLLYARVMLSDRARALANGSGTGIEQEIVSS